jgi:hypothetical protein
MTGAAALDAVALFRLSLCCSLGLQVGLNNEVVLADGVAQLELPSMRTWR